MKADSTRPLILDWNDWCDLCLVMRHLTWGNEASTAWYRMKERVEKRRMNMAMEATSDRERNEEQPAALGNQNSELGLRGGAR